MWYQTISRYLDRWLPAGLDDKLTGKAEMKIRARVLVGLFFTCLVTVALCFIVFLALQLFSNHDFTVALASLGAAVLVLGLQALLFYRSGNVGISAIMFSMSFFSSTLLVMVFTGGWDSPVKQLFFCSPLISFLVGGRHEGVYTSVLTLAAGLTALVAHNLDFQIFKLIKPENIDTVGAVIWVISINIMLSCLYVYDAILKEYSRLAGISRGSRLR